MSSEDKSHENKYVYIIWSSIMFHKRDLNTIKKTEDLLNIERTYQAAQDLDGEETLELISQLQDEIDNAYEEDEEDDRQYMRIDKSKDDEEYIEDEENYIEDEEEYEEKISVPLGSYNANDPSGKGFLGLSDMFMSEIEFFNSLQAIYEQGLLPLEDDNTLFSPPLINSNTIGKGKQSAMLSFVYIADEGKSSEEAETDFWKKAELVMEIAPESYGFFEILISQKVLLPKDVAYSKILAIKTGLGRIFDEDNMPQDLTNKDGSPSLTLV